jgi:hypothetical protein
MILPIGGIAASYFVFTVIIIEMNNRKDDSEIVRIATKEQTEYVEYKLVKLCNIYFNQIDTLSEKRLGALI